jgi:DNA-directed RNA polymerase subunit M/transcription elongation factor TFIIS
MIMLQLKACPRCAGDMHTSQDLYGNYIECLQCGYMKDLPGPSELLKSLKVDFVGKKVA